MYAVGVDRRKLLPLTLEREMGLGRKKTVTEDEYVPVSNW